MKPIIAIRFDQQHYLFDIRRGQFSPFDGPAGLLLNGTSLAIYDAPSVWIETQDSAQVLWALLPLTSAVYRGPHADIAVHCLDGKRHVVSVPHQASSTLIDALFLAQGAALPAWLISQRIDLSVPLGHSFYRGLPWIWVLFWLFLFLAGFAGLQRFTAPRSAAELPPSASAWLSIQTQQPASLKTQDFNTWTTLSTWLSTQPEIQMTSIEWGVLSNGFQWHIRGQSLLSAQAPDQITKQWQRLIHSKPADWKIESSRRPFEQNNGQAHYQEGVLLGDHHFELQLWSN